jgi:hypothetical protein
MAFGGPSVAMSVSSHPSPDQTWWILSNFGTTRRSFEMITAEEAKKFYLQTRLSHIEPLIILEAIKGYSVLITDFLHANVCEELQKVGYTTYSTESNTSIMWG